MHNFEQIRGHLLARYPLITSEPFLACVQIALNDGRRQQSVYLSELEHEDGRRFLRVSTLLGPTTGVDPRRALAFNWESPVGFLAVSALDGVPYLQLCENRPYEGLDGAEIDRLVLEIGSVGDRIEHRLTGGGDLL
ncbi:MAG: hypothetical protein JSS44_04505 [Proteobacteria bacterium]|nr:hypothetical protein [Pseudomonadota bacterium]MBS0462941.1 hypothetical protein [Pseudomonadota bacterium]MBS0465252.1 hypothetical protein [Pseudomonadota bacterium]